MHVRCAAYRALFWFKQQRVATIFFGGRGVFEIRQKHVTVRGIVLERPADQVDGDDTFNLQALPPYDVQFHPILHCEITPCTVEALRPLLGAIVPGAVLQVTGDFCYDPPHADGPEHFEIHPVEAITVLAPAGVPLKAA